MSKEAARKSDFSVSGMKIISGGQTGVDRAALDAALSLGIPHGGWCPLGRWAEDGPIPSCYLLCETDSPDPAVRTERNVVESDGTLILYRKQLRGGTKLTFQLAQQYGRPCLLVDLDAPPEVEQVRRWLVEQGIKILNVAGPRESQSPGISASAGVFLLRVFGGEQSAGGAS